jgi:RNA polymerase sigma-70 factor (ECF subfamily)
MPALLSPTAPTRRIKATAPVREAAPLDLTDESLMEMIQDQDPRGIELLHDRYAPLVKAMIMRVLHNDAESDDMLQEIYVEIWNRAASYDASKGKPLGWIITLSRRRAIDRLRKREAYCRMEDRLQEATKHQPEEVSGQLEEDVAHSEMREHINRVLGSLPPAQQEVIHLAYYKGLSQREIAAATGIPLGTIKTRLELAIKKLSVALNGYEDLL